jgi:hypothetical protein
MEEEGWVVCTVLAFGTAEAGSRGIRARNAEAAAAIAPPAGERMKEAIAINTSLLALQQARPHSAAAGRRVGDGPGPPFALAA